jgi:hypothetical protein
MNHNQREQWIMSSAILLAIIGYILPWVINGSAGLNLGAHDLASWTTLHPEAQAMLLPSLLMRGQLLLITWLVASGTTRPLFGRDWVIRIIVITGLLLAQLPPLDFVYALDDRNQQQQALLTLVCALGAGVGISGLVVTWQRYVPIGIALVGIVTSLYSWQEALRLMQTYGLPAYTGIGIVFLVGAYGLVLTYRGYMLRQTNRATP